MNVKRFSLLSGGNTLNGIIMNSNADRPTKTVIISHGFASNMMITYPYSKVFREMGYVVIMFDFCMSGSGVSGGSSTQMSVFTQAENLIDVLHYAKSLDIVDNNDITLCGCSQGGLVSALAGAKCEQDIKELILYYPALCIPDDARRGCIIGTKIDTDNIPEKFWGLFVHLGRKYVEDALVLDPYEQICTFSKPVLIIHGIEDTLVNIDYSRKAERLYNNCKLVEVHGDHGFIRKGLADARKVTREYLQN